MIFYFCLLFCIVDLIQAAVVPLLASDRNFTLNYHNNLRRKEQGANMNELRWSKQLAKEADAWANRCNFTYQKLGRGENMAFNSNPGTMKKRIKTAMDAWYLEKKDFSWASKTCYLSCHYSQMVWATTSELGCGMAKCKSLRAFGKKVKNSLFFVCFYRPIGNMGNNIYKVGPPCSKCPHGTSCNKGLCVGGTGIGHFTAKLIAKFKASRKAKKRGKKKSKKKNKRKRNKKGACKDVYTKTKCRKLAASSQCTKKKKLMKILCKESCELC